MLVDGKPVSFEVELDYLVLDLRDRKLVAEVKTGSAAPDPVYIPTRRQLLEYAVLFPEAVGLLLVDMERAAVLETEFPALTALRESGDKRSAPSVSI